MGRPRETLSVIDGKGKSNHITKEERQRREEQEEKAKGNTDKLVAPEYLTKEQVEKFDYLASELHAVDIIGNLDVDALGRFVFHQFEYEKLAKKIRATSPNNMEDYDHLVKQQEKHFKMARQCSADLGLTISSRLKLVTPKTEEEKPKNKFDKFAK